MYEFIPNGAREEYDAVLLDLCQQPPVHVEVRTVGLQYEVRVLSQKIIPEIRERTAVSVLTELTLADGAALLGVFNRFLEDGVLVCTGDCMRYVEQPGGLEPS